jgi:circadian clock protein KaiC
MLDARTSASQWDAAVPTGVTGLDHILGGGLPAHRVHLLEGDPGTGKTTLALQFLLEGLRRGERCLYVCLSETQDELRSVAHSHGWSLDGVTVHELTPSEGILDPDEQYSLFHPSEVELADTINTILERVRELQPTRVVIDSLAEVRLLAREPVRYRRQILALKQFFVGRRATVLLIDDRAAERRDLHVQSISHGVIRLEHIAPDYGPERRRLQVLKLRGVKFRGGYHDFRIETGGIVVFPRIDASEHDGGPALTPVPSGIDALDQLLGGGLMTGPQSSWGPRESVRQPWPLSSSAPSYALAARARSTCSMSISRRSTIAHVPSDSTFQRWSPLASSLWNQYSPDSSVLAKWPMRFARGSNGTA